MSLEIYTAVEESKKQEVSEIIDKDKIEKIKSEIDFKVNNPDIKTILKGILCRICYEKIEHLLD